jgi:hypothetical protein
METSWHGHCPGQVWRARPGRVASLWTSDALDQIMTRAHPTVELALINLHYAKAEILCAGYVSADMLRVLSHIEMAITDLNPMTDALDTLPASLIPAPARPEKKRLA